MLTLEICANSIESAKAAANGGASRIELCNNLAEGGTTPSYGQIKWCLDHLKLETWPLIRPRGGDFLYTESEFESMLIDIHMAKQLGCHGLVTGLLNYDGSIDKDRCRQVIDTAHPLPVAFHRAFDMSHNLSLALEAIIELGFVRILSSGGKENVDAGATNISKLVEQANGRIEMMPGGGINTNNILAIANQTQAKSFHTTARELVKSQMSFINEASKMGKATDEYSIEQSSTSIVKHLVDLLNRHQ